MTAPSISNRMSPSGPQVAATSDNVGTPYFVGPSWTGAPYQDVQSALDEAAASGNGDAYGGVVINIYPGSYPAVTVPPNLFNWHLVGIGDGGPTGPFLGGLTFNHTGTTRTQFSVTGIALSNVNINQADVGAGVWYANFYDVWVFGNAVVNGPNLRVLWKDCHWYGGNGQLTMDTQWAQVQGCEFLQGNFAQSLTADTIYFLNNLLRNSRLVVEGTFTMVAENIFANVSGTAVVDTSSSDSYAYNNVFVGGGTMSSPVYDKSSGGGLIESGNSVTSTLDNVFPFFTTPTDRVTLQQHNGVLNLSGSYSIVATDLAGVNELTVAKEDGGGTITLPPLSEDVPEGCLISIKDRDGNATATPITVEGDGAETIDGSASVSITSNFGLVKVQAGENGWMVV